MKSPLSTTKSTLSTKLNSFYLKSLIGGQILTRLLDHFDGREVVLKAVKNDLIAARQLILGHLELLVVVVPHGLHIKQPQDHIPVQVPQQAHQQQIVLNLKKVKILQKIPKIRDNCCKRTHSWV